MRVAGSRAELRRVPASSNPSTCKALTQGCAGAPEQPWGPRAAKTPATVQRAEGGGRTGQ